MNKFKVGDMVRITKEVVATDKPFIGKSAKIKGTYSIEMYSLEGITGFMRSDQLELVKASFTKADMQIGQAYKMRNGVKLDWERSDVDYYTDDLKCKDDSPQYDVAEVYHFSPTPIWKREEPKYRVKTELTKEQAEKLGLEFCEEVTE